MCGFKSSLLLQLLEFTPSLNRHPNMDSIADLGGWVEKFPFVKYTVRNKLMVDIVFHLMDDAIDAQVVMLFMKL